MLACDLCHKLYTGPDDIIGSYTIILTASSSEPRLADFSEPRELCKSCKGRVLADIKSLLVPGSHIARRAPSNP